MAHPRPTPFDLVFQQAARNIFPRIRNTLEEGGHDPRDRDRFLMVRDAVGLLRELRPEEGLGEGIGEMAALLHHAYLFWSTGERIVEISADQLAELLMSGATADGMNAPPYFAQFPVHRVWAEVIPGGSHEPLDGCFIHTLPETSTLRVLGVFGVHPDREGFTVVEASGPKPETLARQDGSPLFSPVLTGGAAAGLFSITGEEELLELGWRVELGARTPWTHGFQLPAPSS
jgi:hypothetical protein